MRAKPWKQAREVRDRERVGFLLYCYLLDLVHVHTAYSLKNTRDCVNTATRSKTFYHNNYPRPEDAIAMDQTVCRTVSLLYCTRYTLAEHMHCLYSPLLLNLRERSATTDSVAAHESQEKQWEANPGEERKIVDVDSPRRSR